MATRLAARITILAFIAIVSWSVSATASFAQTDNPVVANQPSTEGNTASMPMLQAKQVWTGTGGPEGTGWRTEKSPNAPAVVTTLTINEANPDTIVALYTYDTEDAPKGQFRKTFTFTRNQTNGSFSYGDGTPTSPFMSFAPNGDGLDGTFRIGDNVSHAHYTLSGTDATG